jgi:hypothetical protein
VAARRRSRSLGFLFSLLTAGFLALAAWAGASSEWIFAVAAGALGVWLAELAFRSLR